MKSMSRFKKILYAFIATLIGVSVITDTPPLVFISSKPYFVFIKKLQLGNYGENISNKDVKALNHFKWLEELALSITRITDVSFLSKMGSLKKMIYSGEKSIEGDYVVEDWTPLSNCKELEYFSGINMDIYDLSVFKDMANLKTLSVEMNCDMYAFSKNPQIIDISDVKYLDNLEVFAIYGNGINDISALKYCTKLKTLYLYVKTADDYSVLLELPKLELLIIDKGVLTKGEIKILEEKGVSVYENEFKQPEMK